ncbi:polymorphic toxin-type HINT domain-containing protein [Nocardiopsis ganjiahuensis]|uniref:polymorphic toxin-type HINT domain-containing protein n=1 Tax=Nocardiopsis ganjiahuensis TaxID=239984 RepID=UPI000370D35B|nr:polymorphic toxin-type HINT domain-containing protein [Nocardiopsis ganjiahuensis]
MAPHEVFEGVPEPEVAGDVIVATDGHPFWVPDLGLWVDAVDLAPGMWLQTSSGTWVQVSAVQARTQSATVHNLTVQGVHTYHVAMDSVDVLNHNCGGGATVYRGVSEKADKQAVQIRLSRMRSTELQILGVATQILRHII